MKRSLLLALLIPVLQPLPGASQVSRAALLPAPVHPLGAWPSDPPSAVDPAAGDLSRQASYERDRELGGLYGLGVGALAGGLGFAAVIAVANSNSSSGAGYWVLALFVGGIGGGAVGTVTGAIMGAPRASAGSPDIPTDHGRGALRGLKVGSAVGGLGFVVGNYVFTGGDPEQSAILTALIGAAFGGTVGTAVGYVIGVPAEASTARQPAQQRSAVFRAAPSLAAAGRVGLTGSLRLP